MLPELRHFQKEESGIKRVVEAYQKYLPDFGIEVVEEGQPYDLKVAHAGTNTENIDVCHAHGLYWTADMQCSAWEWKSNRNVIDAMRQARVITVPSEWVAETIRRDMRRNPTVIGHGIDWEDWQHESPNEGYCLWNKNRSGQDVCDPTPLEDLSAAFSYLPFVTTFAPKRRRQNIVEIGVVPHEQMKSLVQGAAVYLSTAKETFGIGVLEAMASGVPVLGYAHGGNVALVEHGINGYLAEPGNMEDLMEGLDYCLKYRDTLGANGREMARLYTWERAVEKVARVYEQAWEEPAPTVAVIIPSYLYADSVGRAIGSAVRQTYTEVKDIVVVDDGSPDAGATEAAVKEWSSKDGRVRYIRQENQGVAVARNRGIAATDTKYVCCLDADDAIEPNFLKKCIRELEQDHSLGLVYTKIRHVLANGETGVSPWPGEWDFDRQLKRANQVPTCNVYRREVWESLGGYKKRYCPIGAGSEDAEFWTRIGAYGWKCQLVPEPLFIYSLGTGRVSGNKEYNEPDWLAWHPWALDEQHPFASYATPKRFSHPVRQYDEPVVSVVIPVGSGHEQSLEEALDSLEAQSFRQWECIVVWDTGEKIPKRLTDAYPYVRWAVTEKTGGAGAARNFGAKMARAPFLLFLDADDYLYPEAIEIMTEEWKVEEAIIYTDYVGKAFIDDPTALDPKLAERIVWREPDGLTAIRYEALDYEPERAQRQPHGDPSRVYTWNLITSLIPRAWHEEAGGFDEAMPSWEDVDYFWRLAKLGKCFRRVAEPLVVYHFYTGVRRDQGVAQHEDLFKYLQEKHERMEVMGCRGCGSKSRTVPTPAARSAPPLLSEDEDFALAVYRHPNRGQHTVIGQAVFANRLPDLHMVGDRGGGWRIHYGFRGGGESFLVHKADIGIAPHLFEEVKRRPQPPAVEKEPTPAPEPIVEEEEEEPLAAPKPIDMERFVSSLSSQNGDEDKPFDLQKLPGVTSKIARQMGDIDPEEIVEMGEEGLMEFDGVGNVRARMIYNAALEMLKGG